MDYLHYNNIVHDCAWNPLVQDNPAEEEKKSKKKAKQEKKSVITMNTLNKMFVLCDADRFIAIDLLVHGNVIYGKPFESLCASLRSVCLIFCLMF